MTGVQCNMCFTGLCVCLLILCMWVSWPNIFCSYTEQLGWTRKVSRYSCCKISYAVKCSLTELTTKSAVLRSCGQWIYALCRHIGFVITCYHRCRDLPAILPSWSMVVFVFTPIPPSLSFSTDSSVCVASLVWGLMAGWRGFSSHGVQFYLGAGCTISGSPWISHAPTFHYKQCSC